MTWLESLSPRSGPGLPPRRDRRRGATGQSHCKAPKSPLSPRLIPLAINSPTVNKENRTHTSTPWIKRPRPGLGRSVTLVRDHPSQEQGHKHGDEGPPARPNAEPRGGFARGRARFPKGGDADGQPQCPHQHEDPKGDEQAAHHTRPPDARSLRWEHIGTLIERFSHLCCQSRSPWRYPHLVAFFQRYMVSYS